MRTKILVWLFCSFPFLCLLAQNKDTEPNVSSYTIKGILIDSLTQESEPYATIRIVRKNNPDEVVRMAVSDDNGVFQEKVTSIPDTLLISFTSVGKETLFQEIVLSPDNKVMDLGTIYIQESSQMLGGVEVVAQKPLVKVNMDKIEYSVEDDPDSQTNNILEILRKVPYVIIDGEDNIMVNGSSNFKIHVNGKPNNMMSNNPKEILKSMPANTIKYIEVIKDPGAKYDAEGVGGILNIVTIDGGIEGYTATFNASVNNYGGGGGAYATVQSGKFTVSGNYSYYLNRSQSYTSEGYRESFTSDTYKYLYSEGENKQKGNYQYGGLEGSYEIDTLRLISFSANMYDGNFRSPGNSSVEMKDVLEEPVYSYNSYSNSENLYRYVGASLDYQRSFHKKGEMLTFSYRMNNNPGRSKNRVEYGDVQDYPFDLWDIYSKNKSRTIEHTFQADYVNPLNENNEIETGVKYIIRNSHSDSHYYQITDEGELEPDPLERDNEYDHLQDIVAAYVGYRLKVSKFAVKPGLRYEHTFMKVKYGDNNYDDFSTGFDDLVPSINMSYQVADMKTLRFSYNMRISRPGIWFLNPFVNRSNPDNISFGNPDLSSEKNHSFGLNFSNFNQKINLDLGLHHSFTNNSIQRYSWIGYDEVTGRDEVVHNTYKNSGKFSNTNLSVYFNWNIQSTTRFYVNGNLSYRDIEGTNNANEKIQNDGFVFNTHAGLNHTLPWSLRLSVNGGGGTRNVSLQGNNSGYYYYSVGVNRQFLKERLTLSLHGSNIFENRRSYSSSIEDTDFYQRNKGSYKSRYLSFNISYRIGELKAGVKKASRSIHNDDVKSGGDGGGSGQN